MILELSGEIPMPPSLPIKTKSFRPLPRKSPKSLSRNLKIEYFCNLFKRINFDTGFEPTTPRAVQGRDHFTCQTEPFVETLRDKAIQYEKECQTDLFLDRPAERLFNAMDGKTGVDFSTQVIEDDPELFDFDYEVQPILDVLTSLFRHFLVKSLKLAECNSSKKNNSRTSKRRKFSMKRGDTPD